MIHESELAKAYAYAAKNHGYRNVKFYMATPSSWNHTVTTDDPFCGALSNAIHCTSDPDNHNITRFGNIDNYDREKMIIPIAKHYFNNIPVDIKLCSRITFPASSNDTFRQVQIGIYDYTSETETLVQRHYFRPNSTNEERIFLNVDGRGLLYNISNSPHDYGIFAKFSMQEGDSIINAALFAELIY